MPSKLENITRTLTNPTRTVKPYAPRCQKCGDYGYTGCDEARIPGLGDFIGVALRKGVACSCAAGGWFAEAQLRNLEMGQ